MTYQEEQNKLLKHHLFSKERDSKSIEFIITSACNQSCEYCYLFKHGREMYPPESNKPENILTNFPILLDWLEENEFKFDTYDIFSGEFFAFPYWEDIFQIIIDHEQKMLAKDPDRKLHFIDIPTNGSFLLTEESTQNVINWYNKLMENNLDLHLSISVDGPQEIEALERPLNNHNIKTGNNFYERMWKFKKKYQLSGHPMVTKNFLKNYKINYDWWIDNTIKHDIRFDNDVYAIPMLLEVRDPDQWDEESLANYEKFLNYVVDKDFSTIHENDLDDFAWHFIDDFSDNIATKGRYCHVQPYIAGYPYLVNKMPCSIQSGPVFRVGDLAWVPCHRTCYPQNVYGKFEVQNGKIIGLKAQNPILAIKIKSLNPNISILKCSSCSMNSLCLKGCLGSQLEHTKELFCAQDEICEMYRVKYKTIHEIAKRYDIYSWVNASLEVPKSRKEFMRYARSVIETL